MAAKATDQNNTKSNSLAASNIHYRKDVKANITQENNRIAVIGEYSEQKDTLQAATAGEAHESFSAAADCAPLRQILITRAEKHGKFLSGAVAE